MSVSKFRAIASALTDRHVRSAKYANSRLRLHKTDFTTGSESHFVLTSMDELFTTPTSYALRDATQYQALRHIERRTQTLQHNIHDLAQVYSRFLPDDILYFLAADGA